MVLGEARATDQASSPRSGPRVSNVRKSRSPYAHAQALAIVPGNSNGRLVRPQAAITYHSPRRNNFVGAPLDASVAVAVRDADQPARSSCWEQHKGKIIAALALTTVAALSVASYFIGEAIEDAQHNPAAAPAPEVGTLSAQFSVGAVEIVAGAAQERLLTVLANGTRQLVNMLGSMELVNRITGQTITYGNQALQLDLQTWQVTGYSNPLTLAPGSYDVSVIFSDDYLRNYGGTGELSVEANEDSNPEIVLRPLVGEAGFSEGRATALLNLSLLLPNLSRAERLAKGSLGLVLDGAPEVIFALNPGEELVEFYANMAGGMHEIYFRLCLEGVPHAHTDGNERQRLLIPGQNLGFNFVDLAAVNITVLTHPGRTHYYPVNGAIITVDNDSLVLGRTGLFNDEVLGFARVFVEAGTHIFRAFRGEQSGMREAVAQLTEVESVEIIIE